MLVKFFVLCVFIGRTEIIPCSYLDRKSSVIHTRPKLCHFSRNVVRAKLFCSKRFVPVTGLECSYGNIFIPAIDRLRPSICMNTSLFFTKKKVARRNRPTESARLTGLIWRGPFTYFLSYWVFYSIGICLGTLLHFYLKECLRTWQDWHICKWIHTYKTTFKKQLWN